MKNFFLPLAIGASFLCFAEATHFKIGKPVDEIPTLIPNKKSGKFGYVTQNGVQSIPAKFDMALFFKEDCNLLNSANAAVKQYGTKDFATVEVKGEAFRINNKGAVVYKYKTSDLGKCQLNFVPPAYSAFKKNNDYGLVGKDAYGNPDLSKVYIQPQYQYLFVMEAQPGDDSVFIAIKMIDSGWLIKIIMYW